MEAGGTAAWLNGAIVEPERLTIPLMSNAVFRGTSVFDVMPVALVDSVPHAIGLRPHLERLLLSAREMNLEHRHTLDELVDAVHRIAGDRRESMIVRTVIANAGGSGGGADANVVVAMTTEPWHRAAADPLRLAIATAKIPTQVLPPAIKVAASYAAGLRAEAAAVAAGSDGIVNMSPDADLLEGVSASVGLVIDGAIHLPPPSQVLDSVTRRLAVDAATSEGIDIVVAGLPIDNIDRASGAFLASSTKLVVPVAQIGSAVFDTSDPVVDTLCRTVDEVVAGRHALSGQWLTALASTGR